jgi:predicted transport protein
MAAKKRKVADGTPRVVGKLTAMDVTRIRLRSRCDVRTIGRWAKGDTAIRSATSERIEEACEKLGIELST